MKPHLERSDEMERKLTSDLSFEVAGVWLLLRSPGSLCKSS